MRLLLAAVWALFAAPAFASDRALPRGSAASELRRGAAEEGIAAIPFTEFRLPNGLRVLLSPDKAVPVVTAAMVFDVGGRHEAHGRSGFAHLFEHLMFAGSAHAPKGQFDRILEGYGAVNNASTHMDFTFYYETLPAHVLPVAFWLDADRLSALDVSEENMRNQVDVVQEERRMRVDNQPYAPLLWVEVASRSFANWANAHPTIGSYEDLRAATLKDVRSFFDAYYAPSNAALAVVGDFEPKSARALIARYFDWIPDRPSPARPDPAEPPQAGKRSFSLEDAQANLPGVALVWTGMPERRSPEYYALTLLGRLLFEGRAARLYQLLVKEAQVATAVDEPQSGGLGFPVSDWREYKAPGLFGGFILHKSSVTARAVEELALGEIARIAREGVGEEELSRVKTKLRSEWLLERQSTLGRAAALLRAAALDGDPAAANGELERFLMVGPGEIQAAAAGYLVPERQNLFVLKPKRSQGAPEGSP